MVKNKKWFDLVFVLIIGANLLKQRFALFFLVFKPSVSTSLAFLNMLLVVIFHLYCRMLFMHLESSVRL